METKAFLLACKAIEKNPELIAAMLTDRSIQALAEQRERVDAGNAAMPEMEALVFQRAIRLNPRFA